MDNSEYYSDVLRKLDEITGIMRSGPDYDGGGSDGVGPDGGGGGSVSGSTGKRNFLGTIDKISSLAQKINGAVNGTVSDLKAMYGHLNHMIEPWKKADVAASKYAKTIAMTAEGMKQLRKNTIDNVVNSKIGISYNVSTEELIEMQQKYVQSVGRSLRIDNTQQESLAAMHAVMQGRENELAAAFENFGVSLNGVADHAGKMFADASKSGLSFEKYSDNVAKNIKIAQNYTFKNGLKGLESMAKKALALKLDMSQVASFAEKVSTIEGSIDVASKLQVLGGQFAAIADPLSMLTEGLMDMEGLTDRVINMIGGLGTFDRKRGEVEVSAFNKQRIKAAAQAMGMDYSQLMESVNASARREEVTRQISKSATASGLNDDMKELIKNSATFNEKGEAGVSINGNFKTIDTLTNGDYEDLVKETQDQAADIKDIAKMLRSIEDVQKGTRKQYEAAKAQSAERWGLGNAVKSIIKTLGTQTWLLKIIALGSWAKSLLGIFTNGLSILKGWGSVFRGGSYYGGGVKGAVGRGAKSLGSAANRIGQRFKGTRFGNFFRKAGAKMYRFGGRASSAEAKALNGIDSKLGNIAGKVGTNTEKAAVKNVTEKVGRRSLREMSGRFGANSITRVSRLGTKLTENGYTKLGGALTRHASKQATEYGMKNVAKFGGKKIAAKTATKIGTKMAAGVAKGGVVGIIGAAGNIATDMLVDSGRIKKGGAGHKAMKIGSTALEGAALGATIGSVFPGIGTAIGTAVGAIGGAVVGAFKMAKVKREVKVDDKLAKLGIQRKGNYGSRSYKLINKALETGEISDRMRRKLEKKGDTAILEAIDKKKKEKEKEKGFGRFKSNVAKGMFTVQNAYFNGIAFGGQNIKRNGEYTDAENEEINTAISKGEISAELLTKLQDNGEEEILKAIEERQKNPNANEPKVMMPDFSKLDIQKNKFGVANFSIGVGNFGTFGRVKRKDGGSERHGKLRSLETVGNFANFSPFNVLSDTFNLLIEKNNALNNKKDRYYSSRINDISNEISDLFITPVTVANLLNGLESNRGAVGGNEFYVSNIDELSKYFAKGNGESMTPVTVAKLLNGLESNRGAVGGNEFYVSNIDELSKDSYKIIDLLKSIKEHQYYLKPFNNRGIGISNINGKPEIGYSHELELLRTKNTNSTLNGGNSETKVQPKQEQSSPINGKIEINISGTIKLAGANGKEVDITDKLLNDNTFIRQLTQMVARQMPENAHGADKVFNGNPATYTVNR